MWLCVYFGHSHSDAAATLLFIQADAHGTAFFVTFQYLTLFHIRATFQSVVQDEENEEARGVPRPLESDSSQNLSYVRNSYT